MVRLKVTGSLWPELSQESDVSVAQPKAAGSSRSMVNYHRQEPFIPFLWKVERIIPVSAPYADALVLVSSGGY